METHSLMLIISYFCTIVSSAVDTYLRSRLYQSALTHSKFQFTEKFVEAASCFSWRKIVLEVAQVITFR